MLLHGLEGIMGKDWLQVFDKAAVKITIVETTGHRQHVSLELIDRSELPPSELSA